MSRDPEFPPSGCAHCGLERRLHFSRWTDAAGWHVWTEPSREQIRQRMRQRYFDRQWLAEEAQGSR